MEVRGANVDVPLPCLTTGILCIPTWRFPETGVPLFHIFSKIGIPILESHPFGVAPFMESPTILILSRSRHLCLNSQEGGVKTQLVDRQYNLDELINQLELLYKG